MKKKDTTSQSASEWGSAPGGEITPPGGPAEGVPRRPFRCRIPHARSGRVPRSGDRRDVRPRGGERAVAPRIGERELSVRTRQSAPASVPSSADDAGRAAVEAFLRRERGIPAGPGRARPDARRRASIDGAGCSARRRGAGRRGLAGEGVLHGAGAALVQGPPERRRTTADAVEAEPTGPRSSPPTRIDRAGGGSPRGRTAQRRPGRLDRAVDPDDRGDRRGADPSRRPRTRSIRPLRRGGGGFPQGAVLGRGVTGVFIPLS